MRTPKELKVLIEKHETHNIEFKSKFEAEKVGQAICAFANDWPLTGEGTLIIGVDNKTLSIIGIQNHNRDDVQREVSDICRSAVNLEKAPVIYIVDLEKPVLVIEVPPSQHLPIRYKNSCYIRVGTSTRVANFYEELTLYKRNKIESRLRMIEDRLPVMEQAIEFTGREQELADLWSWMKNKDSNRCALSGDGGKGKTAIAYEFASRITEASPEPYVFALWASAKRRQFIRGEIVTMPAPDFVDLPSLLDKLLTDIGFPEDIILSIEDRMKRVLELLTTFPSLVVIDDLDSIDWSTDNATMEFVTYNMPHTKSKILITTRRQIPSVFPIFVSGFNEDDGIQFIDSRIKLSGMKTNILSQEEKIQALKTADSSPLYLEDLLRLFVITGDLKETLVQWSSRSGEEARIYALKREFDLLSSDAKQALLAFSILDQPATSAEAKAVAAMTWAKWNEAMDELQRLFLIPRPGIIEGLSRFSLNSNTKALIMSVLQGTPEITKFQQNLRNLSGESYRDLEKRKSVGSLIRQASAYIRADDCDTAQKIIEAGINKVGEDPDLVGALGWVYKCNNPPRVADAREKFKRSAELKCNNPEMYKHWYEMEDSHEYFNESIDAAKSALSIFPNNQIWEYRLAYASGRFGELLIRQFQPRGRIYLFRANKILERLIQKMGKTIPFDLDLHKTLLRSLVLNSAGLYNSVSGKEKDVYCKQFALEIKRWKTSYGGDPAVDYESTNLLSKYPEVAKVFKNI